MPTIVRTPDPADFLALVPHLAGFVPRNSLLLVGFRGKLTHGTMRFDLPPGEDARTHRRIATSVVGMLSRLPGVDAVVPVIYTDAGFGRVIPHERFMREILRRIRFSGFVLRDALCVAADGWASYLDDDYPPGGDPLEQIGSSTAVHDAGLPAVHGLLDRANLPSVPLVDAESVARYLRDLRSEVRASENDCLVDRWWIRSDLPMHLESALLLRPEDLTTEGIAMIILLLQRPSVRDAAMLQWAFDPATGYRVAELNRRFHLGEDITDDADGSLMLGEGPRPDAERVERSIALLRLLTAHAPLSSRPPLLCMLAWLHWALGRSSVSDVFVRLALDIQPSYGLAELLAAMLDNGMLPPWAFGDADGFVGDGGRGTSGCDSARQFTRQRRGAVNVP